MSVMPSQHHSFDYGDDEQEHGCKACSEICEPPCIECKKAFEDQFAEEAEAIADQHEAMAESGQYDP